MIYDIHIHGPGVGVLVFDSNLIPCTYELTFFIAIVEI